jgi:hypothetical protein
VIETRLVYRENGGYTKIPGNVCGFDGNTFAIVKIRGEMSGVCVFVLSEMEDAADGGFDGPRLSCHSSEL